LLDVVAALLSCLLIVVYV